MGDKTKMTREAALLFYMPSALLAGTMVGFGLTNYKSVPVKILGSLISIFFFGVTLYFMVILGKSILEDKKNTAPKVEEENI